MVTRPEPHPGSARRECSPATEVSPPARRPHLVAPSAIEPAPRAAVTAAGGLWQQVLDGSREAVIVLDDRGIVQLLNRAARRLLPNQVTGEVVQGGSALAEALAQRNGCEVEHTGFWLTGRPQSLPDGVTAWYVHDVTEQSART